MTILYGKVFTVSTWLFMAVASSAAIAAVSLRVRLLLLREFSPVVMTLTVLWLLNQSFSPKVPSWIKGPQFFLWAALALAWAYACAFVVWRPLRDGLMGDLNAHHWLHGGVAFLVGLFVFSQAPGLHPSWSVPFGMKAVLCIVPADLPSLVVFGLAALAVMALARWPGFKPGLYLGLFYLLIAHRVFYALARPSGRNADLLFLFISIGLGLLTLAAVLLAWRLRPEITRKNLRRLQWGGGALTLLLCLCLFSFQRGALGHYTTAFWGVSAIVIFLAGLLGRAKPLRITGLVGLALCIPRIFIIDIHSSLYRIAATAALGAVVLAVAFLYSKYRVAIEAWDAEK